MRLIGVVVLFLVACGEMDGQEGAADALSVPCGTGGVEAERWVSFSADGPGCPSLPQSFMAVGTFDGNDWCSLARSAVGTYAWKWEDESPPYAMASCRDLSCGGGRVEVEIACAGGPQRYFMTVAPR
jgi:hypothetical protein